MNFPHPTITPSTYADALAAGCDCVQLRYDGFPVVINCAARTCNIFHDWPRAREKVDSAELRAPLDALLVGAKSRGTPVVYLYDMWWYDGQDLQKFTFRERYILTRSNLDKLDERFTIAEMFPIRAAPELWKQVIADPERLKGLVFRRSRDVAAGELFVKQWGTGYDVAPGEFV